MKTLDYEPFCVGKWQTYNSTRISSGQPKELSQLFDFRGVDILWLTQADIDKARHIQRARSCAISSLGEVVEVRSSITRIKVRIHGSAARDGIQTCQLSGFGHNQVGELLEWLATLLRW